MKEEGIAEHKVDIESEDKQTTEEEKEKDTKEDTNTAGNEGAESEQKQDEEKPEKTDADQAEEKPEEVAVELASGEEHVAVPIEEATKTENAEGGEGEIKTESTEGGEGEPSQEEAMPVTSETVVTNETETGMNYSKYEIDDELPWAMYRSLDTPPQRSPVEEDDDWPASDEDEDYGRLLKIIILL